MSQQPKRGIWDDPVVEAIPTLKEQPGQQTKNPFDIGGINDFVSFP